VRGGYGGKLFRGFGQGNVEAALAAVPASQEELQRERGFASTRRTLDEVKSVGREASIEDGVYTSDPGRYAKWDRRERGCCHDRNESSRFGCRLDAFGLRHLDEGCWFGSKSSRTSP